MTAPDERCTCTHPREDHQPVDAGCSWRWCTCGWFPSNDIDMWIDEARAARERRFERWREQEAAERAAIVAARRHTRGPRARERGTKTPDAIPASDHGGNDRQNNERSLPMSEAMPAEAGYTSEYGPSWTERIAEAGRTVTSPDEARAVAERVIAEHHDAAAKLHDEDYAAAIMDEALDDTAIDWVRGRLVDDDILHGDYPQQASVHLGRELARLLRAWGSPLEQAQVALTAAALLRVAREATAEAETS